jgi:hypothetical protein
MWTHRSGLRRIEILSVCIDAVTPRVFLNAAPYLSEALASFSLFSPLAFLVIYLRVIYLTMAHARLTHHIFALRLPQCVACGSLCYQGMYVCEKRVDGEGGANAPGMGIESRLMICRAQIA